jgi:type II restriction/modification system DNA methylase subunit YeeA
MSLGFPLRLPLTDPKNLYGIEINEYAHELAQATIWIGYIQWLRENGFGQPSEPILKALDNIHQMDAILAFDEEENPIEPEWPEADVAIGNPPFLGSYRLRSELGDEYVERMLALYKERIPGASDLCCYWFEKARALIEQGKLKRAGLLATQGIRGGANRTVLERIKQSGDIFWAQSDRDWILNGAAVHVSMIGFDSALNVERNLDGEQVKAINPDLSATADLTSARLLAENTALCFRSDEKGGPFDIDETAALRMLRATGNPNGRPNSDVVRPYYNAKDVLHRWHHMWIIDFGCNTGLEQAAQYEAPFEYVQTVVQPLRAASRSKKQREMWWLHRRPGPEMRKALLPLARFVSTPMVSKHRVFVWLSSPALPDHQLHVIARDDDYFFGVLHSKVHELWALRQGMQLEDRPRYTPTTCFETFPFPWPPGEEPIDDPRFRGPRREARPLAESRRRR